MNKPLDDLMYAVEALDVMPGELEPTMFIGSRLRGTTRTWVVVTYAATRCAFELSGTMTDKEVCVAALLIQRWDMAMMEGAKLSPEDMITLAKVANLMLPGQVREALIGH